MINKPFKNGYPYRQTIRVMVNLDRKTADRVQLYLEQFEVPPSTSAVCRMLISKGLDQLGITKDPAVSIPSNPGVAKHESPSPKTPQEPPHEK